MTGRQRVFCSIGCADQYRKREYASRRRKNKNIGLKSQKRSEVKTPNGPNPQLGEGEKKLDCLNYGKCLDIALDWKNFNCEECTLKNR